MTKLSQAQAAKYLLKLRDASDSFEGFVRLCYPDWVIADFQLELINALDKLEKGTLGTDNLLVTMPPRHAKSTFSTVLFPSYFMARNSHRYIMSCSYNSQLATDFGRQVRGVVEQQIMNQAFPEFSLSKESRAADVWRTDQGGAYFAVGVGGTTSGRPANLLIVDDPIKSREDAESMTQRNKTWNYYTSALATRLQPQSDGSNSKQIIILTRWHPDDLAGRLMESEDWKEGRWSHINFPAIKKINGKKVSRRHLAEDDPRWVDSKTFQNLSHKKRYIHEEEEESLWEERFPLEDLKKKRTSKPQRVRVPIPTAAIHRRRKPNQDRVVAEVSKGFISRKLHDIGNWCRYGLQENRIRRLQRGGGRRGRQEWRYIHRRYYPREV